MPPADSKLQSSINVTPLVDVVLVLLIIFMVIAPQLHQVPQVKLPETERAPKKPDNGRQIQVVIDEAGSIWLDERQVVPERFPQDISDAAEQRGDWQVVIKGDARLSFGTVEQAMLAIENAGFKNVGLIAERRDKHGRAY